MGGLVMRGFTRVCVLALLILAPMSVRAGPAEDANTEVARWSAGYTSNDLEAVVSTYWPDAILLGTVSPDINIGPAAIRAYFSRLPGSGNRNDLGEKHTIVLSDDAVVVTGFYLFTRMENGTPAPGPSRFTMLVTRRNGVWHIAHHHSSPRVMPQSAGR
jgi:uncharacterized protein (TIGR02246 family)